MTKLTQKSNKYEKCRVAFREHFKKGLKPADGSQPMSDDQAKEIVQNVTPHLNCVGLFVDEDKEYINSVLEQVELDILQFHGQE